MRCPCRASFAVQHSLLRRNDLHPDCDPAHDHANIGRAGGYADPNRYSVPIDSYKHANLGCAYNVATFRPYPTTRSTNTDSC